MATVTEIPAIGADSAGLLMSPEEFDAIVDYDENYRYELIHGVLVVTPIPLEMESSPNENLGGMLYVYKKFHPSGSSLDATLQERYINTGLSRRRADRVIWAGLGRLPDSKEDPPTIAVEFVSAGKRNATRDYVTKRTEYLDAGIVEYWIIDRFRRIMTIHRKVLDRVDEIVIAEGDIYRTEHLPGFELPLSELLDVSDAWRDRP